MFFTGHYGQRQRFNTSYVKKIVKFSLLLMFLSGKFNRNAPNLILEKNESEVVINFISHNFPPAKNELSNFKN